MRQKSTKKVTDIQRPAENTEEPEEPEDTENKGIKGTYVSLREPL